MGLLIPLIGLGQNHLARAESNGSLRGQLESQLGTRISAIWKGQARGLVFDRLAAAHGITFWIDRRVDLQRPVEEHFHNLPLRKVLNTLTKDQSLGWSNLGSICYVGPQDAAHEIATLLELAKESVQKLPARKRDIWLHQSARSWPRLSEPRLLLAEWLAEQGIELVHPELISHDLWAAKKLPPMLFVEQVVLILASFDLTCQISSDGDKCIVIPIKRPVRITRVYHVGANWRSIAAQLGTQVPELRLSYDNTGFRSLKAKGRWEDHLKFKELLSGDKSVSPDLKSRPSIARRRLVSLRLENQPLGKVITQLAQQLGLEVAWDKELLNRKPDPRDQLVSCDVVKADIPHLMRSILEPVGISSRLEKGTLVLKGRDE